MERRTAKDGAQPAPKQSALPLKLVQESEVSGVPIQLAFRDVHIADRQTHAVLLAGVSGFVPRGGLLGILGASGSGKTLLTKALAGCMHGTRCSGEVLVEGRVFPLGNTGSPQAARMRMAREEDRLIGVLTVRESLLLAMRLRRNIERRACEAAVDKLIEKLDLASAANTLVGTALRRGVSGGQRRRTSAAMELVALAPVLFIDEPTSGLDTAAAVSLIGYLKTAARESQGRFSVVVTVQQPGPALLDALDYIMILGRKSMLFFGTQRQAHAHFTSLGFAPPPRLLPTDHYLRVTDETFATGRAASTDFALRFGVSEVGHRLRARLEEAFDDAQGRPLQADPAPLYETSAWRQFAVLCHRSLLVAVRDPGLYYLQLVCHALFGFVVGTAFFDMHVTLQSPDMLFHAVTWIVFMQTFVHIFKISALVESTRRFAHEHANRYHGAAPHWLAETLVTALCSLVFVPGVTVAYFMMGLPAAAAAPVLLCLYVLALATESLLVLLALLLGDFAKTIVAGQLALMVLCVFTAGALIAEASVPPWWGWLQELSVFAHSARFVLHMVSDEIDVACSGSAVVVTANRTCTMLSPSFAFPCQPAASGACMVDGLDFVRVFKGLPRRSAWLSLLYLALLGLGLRLACLLHAVAPTRRLRDWLCTADRRGSAKDNAAAAGRVYREESPSSDVEDTDDVMRERAARVIQRAWRAARVRARSQHAAAAHADAPQGTRSSALTWTGLTVVLGTTTTLIHRMDGEARGGRVLALMGASGAGKTTLLNALSGRAAYAKVAGTVLLDGLPLKYKDLQYIPQFDDFHGCFTVREALTYSSRLQRVDLLPTALAQHVLGLATMLGLRPQLDTRCGSLTGGQRKRVSIGLGLTGRPRVLFLDEPTTGLDSSAALHVVKHIKAVTRALGVATILTVHQPSAALFSTLDDFVLLAHGRRVYGGPLSRSVAYFAQLGFRCPPDRNPADFFLSLLHMRPVMAYAKFAAAPPQSLTIDRGTTWESLLAQSRLVPPPAELPSPVSRPVEDGRLSGPRVSEARRLIVLGGQYLALSIRSAMHGVRAVVLAVLAVFLGTLFLRVPQDASRLSDIAGGIFLQVFTVAIAVASATGAYHGQRRLTQHDVLSGRYCFPTHVLAHTLASIPCNLGCALVYQVILHFLMGFNDQLEAFVYATLSSAALMLATEALLMLLVEVVRDRMLCLAAEAVSLGLWFLFCGFPVGLNALPFAVRWLPWLMPTFYLFNGLLVNMLEGQEYHSDLLAGPVSGESILEGVYGHSNSTLGNWASLGVTLAWALVFRAMHVCAALAASRGARGALVLQGPKGSRTRVAAAQEGESSAPCSGPGSRSGPPLAREAQGWLPGATEAVCAHRHEQAHASDCGDEQQASQGGIHPPARTSPPGSALHSPASPARSLVVGAAILVDRIREQRHNSEDAVLLRLARQQRARREAAGRERLVRNVQRLETAEVASTVNMGGESFVRITREVLAQRRTGSLAPYRPATGPLALPGTASHVDL